MPKAVKIPFDLEATPLRIRTDTARVLENNAFAYIRLWTADHVPIRVGYIQLDVVPLQQYFLGWCSKSSTDFPSALPSEAKLEWMITKLPGPRIIVQCNGVTMVDILLSDDTCTSNWSRYWTKQVKQIEFSGTASDQYLPAGNQLTMSNITCSFAYTKFNQCFRAHDTVCYIPHVILYTVKPLSTVPLQLLQYLFSFPNTRFMRNVNCNSIYPVPLYTVIFPPRGTVNGGFTVVIYCYLTLYNSELCLLYLEFKSRRITNSPKITAFCVRAVDLNTHTK